MVTTCTDTTLSVWMTTGAAGSGRGNSLLTNTGRDKSAMFAGWVTTTARTSASLTVRTSGVVAVEAAVDAALGAAVAPAPFVAEVVATEDVVVVGRVVDTLGRIVTTVASRTSAVTPERVTVVVVAVAGTADVVVAERTAGEVVETVRVTSVVVVTVAV